MRVNSCRRCGKELVIEQLCKVCNIPITFHCHACGNITEKQIHASCMLIETSYTPNANKK